MATNPANMRERLRRDSATLEGIENELAAANRACEVHRQALRDAQASLDLAERHKKHLATQLDALNQSLVERRAALSAAHSLPDELIREIFSHTMPNFSVPEWPLDATDDGPVGLASSKINWDRALLPLRLCLVSKRWRAIAHTATELWTYVVVPAKAWLLDHQQFITHVKCVLSRSRSCLLDVLIEAESAICDLGTPSTEPEYIHAFAKKVAVQHNFFWRIFMLINPHAHRIRTLHVYGSVNARTIPIEQGQLSVAADTPEDIQELCMGLLRLPTPQMQEVCLLFCNGEPDSDVVMWFGYEASTFLPSAPKLRRLRVDHAPVVVTGAAHPGLSSLMSLTLVLDHFYQNLLWDTLALCPALDELTLKLGSYELPTGAQSPASVPVRALTLEGEEVCQVFADVELPNLTTLTIPNELMLDFAPLDELTTLTTLTIQDGGRWNLDAFDTEALQGVKHVTLVGGDNDTEPLRERLCRSTKPLWPQLQSFRIDVTDPALERGEWLVRFVEDRLARHAAKEHNIGALERVALPDNVYAAWVVTRLQQLLGQKNVEAFMSDRL